MAGLSNIFGGDNGGAQDSNSAEQTNSDFAQSAGNSLGVDYSDTNSHSSQSADGSSSSDSSGHDFSLNSDSDSLLSSTTDTLGLTQHDSAN